LKRAKPTNPELVKAVRSLKRRHGETGAPVWRDVATRLLRTRRQRITVNLSRLNRYTKAGDTVIVPGKVLGLGKLDHSVHVAAFAFSEQAQSKILKAKGKCLSIDDLTERNPHGSNVKIIG